MKKKPAFKIGQLLTHYANDVSIVNGKLRNIQQPQPVKLLAQSGNYAMVKRADVYGSMPYCCMLRDLVEPLQPKTKDDV